MMNENMTHHQSFSSLFFTHSANIYETRSTAVFCQMNIECDAYQELICVIAFCGNVSQSTRELEFDSRSMDVEVQVDESEQSVVGGGYAADRAGPLISLSDSRLQVAASFVRPPSSTFTN